MHRVTGRLLTSIAADGWQVIEIYSHAGFSDEHVTHVTFARAVDAGHARTRDEWLEHIKAEALGGNDPALYSPVVWTD